MGIRLKGTIRRAIHRSTPAPTSSDTAIRVRAKAVKAEAMSAALHPLASPMATW